jgi:hypothetical protein
MLLPRIHLNGSDPDQLFQGYMVALEKAQEALQALRAVDVNGRDYYPLGGNAVAEALEEHRARCGKLQSIIDDLSAIAEHIDERR